ncbi:MAG: aspartate carbamoyltransferase [Acutalibacteraceae bacterium]
MKHRHVIDLEDLTFVQLREIVELAGMIKKNPERFSRVCDGKILATLFYEPSTRTQMSFQTAMMRLGGKVIGFDNPQNSSVAKGESLKDTIKVMSGYADIIAIRHPVEGSAKASSLFSDVPVINGGDGGHLHPTQTLTDVVTLYNEKGRLNHLTIGLCGDLKNGRTVHSLIKTMCHFEGNEFLLISTPELTVPDYIKEIMIKNNCKFTEVTSLAENIDKLDVLYMTRIQRERFKNDKEYENQKGVFILDSEKMKSAKSDMIVMHPLPRVDEISVSVDDDPRACYFKQAIYGMYGRMALIMLLLKDKDYFFQTPQRTESKERCKNPNCITNSEKYLTQYCYEKDGKKICDYCDREI